MCQSSVVKRGSHLLQLHTHAGRGFSAAGDVPGGTNPVPEARVVLTIHQPGRKGQGRAGQVMLCQIKSGQVRLDLIRSNQVKQARFSSLKCHWLG